MTSEPEEIVPFLHRTRSRKLTGPELTHLHELMAISFGTNYQMWNPPGRSGEPAPPRREVVV